MITLLVFADVLLRAARWPRRRLRAAQLAHHRAAGERRALLAECHRLRNQAPPPFAGSMCYEDDPAARQPGYLGTWQPHRDPWHADAEPAREDWATRLAADVKAAGADPWETRKITADYWFAAYDHPQYKQFLAAEQASLARWLESATAAFHHRDATGGHL